MIEIKINDDGTGTELIEGRPSSLFADLHRAFIAMHSIAVTVYGEKMGEALMDRFADFVKDGTIKREHAMATTEAEYAKK